MNNNNTEETQVIYTPQSNNPRHNALVPHSLLSAMTEGAKKIANLVGGDVDKYVRETLEYSQSDFEKYFSAEQVDTIACCLYQITSKCPETVVVGHTTGFGKGRIAAALLRYWILQRRKNTKINPPIFVTGTTNLYYDLYRDFADIGMSGISAIATNYNLSIPKKNPIIHTSTQAEHDRLMKSVLNGDTYVDLVLTTYDQFRLSKGNTSCRHIFLEKLANKTLIVYDESHSLGSAKKDKMSQRGVFGARLMSYAKASILLSATAAKISDNLGFSAPNELVNIFANISTEQAQQIPGEEIFMQVLKNGGTPLQQIYCAELAQQGLYMRYELPLAGVEFTTEEIPVNRSLATATSIIKSQILEFNEKVKEAVEATSYYNNHIGDNSTGKPGADTTTFTSIAHHLLSVELLAFKAKAIASLAIKYVKAGEKITIALYNTNESHIDRFLKENPTISPGDNMPITFGDILRRYLDRSRQILVGDHFGEKQTITIPDTKLAEWGLLDAYEEIMDMIYENDYSEMPVSPIDVMIHEVEKAGIKVAEITGRTYQIGKNNELRIRPSNETNKSHIVEVCDAFNNKDTDVIIMSGNPLGFSLHSSRAFKNQNPRRTIIIQPNPDIAALRQVIGRTDRTNQVHPPRYTFAVADLPAENRITEILASKLKRLNANVKANSNQSDIPLSQRSEFFGPIGDYAVTQILEHEQDYGWHNLSDKLANPEKNLSTLFMPGLDQRYIEGIAYRVTGRIHLMPLMDQERLWEQIDKQYKEIYEQLQLMNSPIIPSESLDLNAIAVEEITVPLEKLFPSLQKNNSEYFYRPAKITKYNCKSRFPSFSDTKVLEMLTDFLDVQIPGNLEKHGRDKSESIIKFCEKEWAEELDNIRSSYKDPSNQIEFALDRHSTIRKLIRKYSVGKTVRLLPKEENPHSSLTIYGIITKIVQLPRKSPKGQSSLRQFALEIALVNAKRTSIFVSFYDIANEKYAYIIQETNNIVDLNNKNVSIFDLFKLNSENPREEIYIATDNIIATALSLPGAKKAIIYTLADETTKQGIIVSPNQIAGLINVDESNFVTINSSYDLLKTIETGKIARDKEGFLQIQRTARPDQIVIKCPISKKQGGKYYLNQTILDAINQGFTSNHSTKTMEAIIPKYCYPYLWNALQETNVTLYKTKEART